jgi:hypothetical protein
MLHLSTKEVVLSIEKAPLESKHGIVYQEYHNFFGNSMLEELKNLENLDLVQLERQLDRPRQRVEYTEDIMKKVKIFFMNTSIKSALEKKFNTNLKFSSADIWQDKPGYHLDPHTDDPRIKLALQIYLGDNNVGTSLFDKDNNVLKTFEYKLNSGYALLNTNESLHGTTTEVKTGLRNSMYVRFE